MRHRELRERGEPGSPEVYRLLVLGRSWKPELYELTETLIEQLLLPNAVGKRGK